MVSGVPLDGRRDGIIVKTAVNTSIVNSFDESRELQGDLNKISLWSEIWLMKLNADTCSVKLSYRYQRNQVSSDRTRNIKTRVKEFRCN